MAKKKRTKKPQGPQLISRIQMDHLMRGTKTLINNINLTIHTGQYIGLIGENGAWKTSLMQDLISNGPWIMTHGSFAMSDQEIAVDLHDLTIYEYLTDRLPEWAHYTIYDPLDMRDLDPMREINSLSGWQQKRIALLVVVLSQAQVWILDEPTNHLDTIGKEWLIDAMLAHKGAILCVSHDRHFLNAFATDIWAIHDQHIKHYHGDYSDYLTQRQADVEKQQRDFETRDKERKRMEAMVSRIRQQAHGRDDPALGRLLRNKERALQREVYDQEKKPPRGEKTYSFGGSSRIHNGKKVLTINNVDVSRHDDFLFTIDKAEIYGNQRVRLAGPNGSGKTTLLHFLQASTTRQDGQIWRWNLRHCFVDQHSFVAVSGESTIFDYIYKTSRHSHEAVYSHLLSYGFTKDDMDRKVSGLSFWQKMRLTLSLTLLQNYDVLFLDEPTNHLDIASREAIESMLQDFQWALIYVTHDQWFADSVGMDQVRTINDGELEVVR